MFRCIPHRVSPSIPAKRSYSSRPVQPPTIVLRNCIPKTLRKQQLVHELEHAELEIDTLRQDKEKLHQDKEDLLYRLREMKARLMLHTPGGGW